MKPSFALLTLSVVALGFLSIAPIHDLKTIGQNSPAAVLAGLRAATDRTIYTPKTMEGVLEVTHFDDFNSGENTPVVDLVTKTGTVHVDIGTIDHDQLPVSGSTVRINGSYGNNTLKISELASVTELKSAPQTPGATLTGSRSNPTPKKISIVLFNYSNDPGQPFTKEDVRKTYFEPNADSGITMSEFLKKSTYDQMSLEGKTSVNGTTDVWGWYTLPITRTHCDSAPELVTNGHRAIAMAVQAGMQVGPDDIIAVGTFPYSGCTTGGVVSVGNAGTAQYRSIHMSNMLAWGGALHELAHISKIIPATSSFNTSNFLQHSNAFECVLAGVTVPYDTQGSTCAIHEYASPFSILGGYTSGAMRARLMDGQNRIEGGYLGISNIVGGGATGGTYDLTKVNYTDAQILRIPIYVQPIYLNGTRIHTGRSAYIEVEPRDFLPFEQAADTFPNTDVVLIRWKRGSDFSALLRPKLNSRLLAPGQSFYIPSLGTTITNQGATPGNNRKVRVTATYDTGSITEIEPQKITFGSITPQKTTIQSSGSFAHPMLAGTITGEWGDLVIWPHDPVRIFPVGGSQPLDAVIASSMNGWSAQGIPTGTNNFSLDVLGALHISPTKLVGQSRSIYKIMVNINPFSFNTLVPDVPIYLMYGTFSMQELTNLGVTTMPTPTAAQINLTGATQTTFPRQK